MSELLQDLIFESARRTPGAPALRYEDTTLDYLDLAARVRAFASGLVDIGLDRGERVAVYLEKRIETVVAAFGAAAAGGVFVPVNPVLRNRQVGHILGDCTVRVLVTSAQRLDGLRATVEACHDLHTVLLVDGEPADQAIGHAVVMPWSEAMTRGSRGGPVHRRIDADVVSIIYTSGSTGLPKGVVLSHRNMVAGARSVSQYIENTPRDRILCVLPISFDAGFSQLTTAFHVGALAVLTNFLFAKDVAGLVARERITGLAGVPTLWNALAEVTWPEAATRSLRYFTNTGGHMPRATLDKLRAKLPDTSPYLMYGLTEAFRSTYLPPSEVDRRPDSMGKAIPNVEILVVRENGERCGPGEPGELVHRGPLVAQGYWNDPERTAERFKPLPVSADRSGLCFPEVAVWSGDTVRMDEEGFLYFVGRRDEMIKCSGHRVSPTEIEEVVYGSGAVAEAAAFGVAHPRLGQAIVVAATAAAGGGLDREAIIAHCRDNLPSYMVPQQVIAYDSLPRNPNGKIDRKRLAREYGGAFEAQAE